MAEKIDEDTSPSSLQNLTCPLCLDIFDEAAILTSCGHTFCRKCLEKYDLIHQDLDHMVCPLCKMTTMLSMNRVDDLGSNVTVNGLVDEYHGSRGGVIAVLEMRPKCTACKLQCEAVSFCRTCDNYMCDKCLHCHQHLTSLFEGHEILSIQDISEGNVSIGHHSLEKCFTHKHENKDMFCEDCNVHVCLKCVIVGHQNHKIKNQIDFEQELRHKVNDLVQRCAAKKSDLENNIQNVEAQRIEVHTLMQKLQEEVIQSYSIKAKRLEENQRMLIEEIDALKRSFDDDLDTLKSSDWQRIKSICSSMTLVANDRLGRLEMDSLSAHTLLCEELDGMLKEATDYTSAAVVTEKAQRNKFIPADDTRLDLGNISKPELQVIRCVNLSVSMAGLTKYSDDSVAIGYGYAGGIETTNSAGSTQLYRNIPNGMKSYDLVFQQDRSLCVMTGSNEAHIYSSNGSMKSNVGGKYNHVNLSDVKLNRSPSDEIIVTSCGNQVFIYDPMGTTVRHTLRLKHRACQASATSSGLIVASSCFINAIRVTVNDMNGSAGKPLQAPSGVHLYADVDEQDRVYIASGDHKSGKVVIRLYDIDGLNLKERVEFNELKLKVSYWSYLVFLSPGLLAFGCDKKLYFIKVPL